MTLKTKVCSRCGSVLPITEFHRRQHYVRSGVRAACKDCTREAAREAPEENRDELDRFKDQVRAKTRQAIERFPQNRVIGTADMSQLHGSRFTNEQLGPKIIFQQFHLVADS